MRLLLVFFFLFLGCKTEVDINGHWRINISLQDKTLPVIVKLKKQGPSLSGFLVNSKEKIPLEGQIDKGEFFFQIGANYAEFRGKLKDGELKGFWIRTNKLGYKVPFTGTKTSITDLYKKYESSNLPFNFTGNWKIKLNESKTGLGVFKQIGSRVHGSILTTTGDYRYLDGYIKGSKLTLTGFDGVFSYVMTLLVNGESFSGIMQAGKAYKQEISGVKDSEFKLEDPLSLTGMTKTKIDPFKYATFDDKIVDFSNPEYLNKVKVIQVFGSWCPNCLDETQYFVEWQNKNSAKLNDVKFIAMAFEKFETPELAVKALRKTKAKMKMNYPIILADYKSTKTVQEHLPLTNFLAFPTTIILNKKNEVIKVHTGFSGQATGIFFDQFTNMYNDTIDKLIKE
jgi:thiol-disulfide isomerase/thioredoxin